jgi:hypothetical protein
MAMRYVIQNIQNSGYYKVPTNGWTYAQNCTKFPTEELALKQKDALERKEIYYSKLRVLSEDDLTENVRN